MSEQDLASMWWQIRCGRPLGKRELAWMWEDLWIDLITYGDTGFDDDSFGVVANACFQPVWSMYL